LLTKRPISLEKLHQFADQGYLYAIVDACDAPVVPLKMQELGETQALSLFKGTPKEDYWAVAPYLLRVRPETLRWIRESFWNDPWGIFLFSKSTLEEMHQHFRGLLVVLKPDGRYWFFRYYDPHVLETFLATCSPAEAKMILGTARACAISIRGSDQCIMFLGKEGGTLAHMFLVRREHEELLDQKALLKFQFQTLEHLKRCFPEQCHFLKDATLLDLVRHGIEQARSYGILDQLNVGQYIDLLFVFGPGFERNSNLPWAREILTDPACQCATLKINRLYEAGLDFLARVAHSTPTI
jgi:Domain of unknown function (DUF4123)